MNGQSKGARRTLLDIADAFVLGVGNALAWLNALLVVVIISQVILRYGFSNGMEQLEELQWHLYGVGIMFGISYAMVKDSHVRMDIAHNFFGERTKAFIEAFGLLFLVAPIIYVVLDHSYDFVATAWRVGERSVAPSGLPYRWAIKAVIPASFMMLGIATITRFIRSLRIIMGKGGSHAN